MKNESNWGDAGRTFFVFFFWLFFLSLVLHFGLALDPSGDPEFDRELSLEKGWFGIPIQWIVLPFVVISSILLTWIDVRQRERKRANRFR